MSDDDGGAEMRAPTGSDRERLTRWAALLAAANDRQSPLLVHITRQVSLTSSYHMGGRPEDGIVCAAIAGHPRAVWELCGGAEAAQAEWDCRHPDLLDNMMTRHSTIAHGLRGRGDH